MWKVQTKKFTISINQKEVHLAQQHSWSIQSLKYASLVDHVLVRQQPLLLFRAY